MRTRLPNDIGLNICNQYVFLSEETLTFLTRPFRPSNCVRNENQVQWRASISKYKPLWSAINERRVKYLGFNKIEKPHYRGRVFVMTKIISHVWIVMCLTCELAPTTFGKGPSLGRGCAPRDGVFGLRNDSC